MSERLTTAQERQERVRQEIAVNPVITDEELAEVLSVSVHTIRADRKTLGIPEARKRAHDAAQTMFARPRTLGESEIVGEILEAELDKSGLSLLDTTSAMATSKTGIVRGHILYAQANTLANAIIDAEVALTRDSKVRYVTVVRAGERVLAKARVLKSHGRQRIVEVVMKTRDHIVLEGTFTVVSLTRGLVERLGLMKE
jgi:acyl-coenzyme A thioesterase PaaI-like protein